MRRRNRANFLVDGAHSKPNAMDKSRAAQAMQNENDDTGSTQAQDTVRGSAITEQAVWNASGRRGHDGQCNRLPETWTSANRPLRRKQRNIGTLGILGWLLVLSIWSSPASAAFLKFENCLTEDYKTITPLKLQFIPLFVSAVFDTKDPGHNLNVTVYGTVNGTGPAHLVLEPPANNTDYWDSNSTIFGGKIERQPDPSVSNLTTLFSKVNVLTYEPFDDIPKDFCGSLMNGASCPLGPAFKANL
jgi:hypothetical protein